MLHRKQEADTKKVVVIQRIVPHYRLPVFRMLAGLCQSSGIDFLLIYGQEEPGTVPKSVSIDEPWAKQVTNRYFHAGSSSLVWMPCLNDIKGADLIIIEQANSNLINIWLLLLRKFTTTKVAYWGHGRNMQSKNPEGLSERLKGALIRSVDWWFCYTRATANNVQAAGFPGDQCTVLNNSIDIKQFKADLELVDSNDVYQLKGEMGLTDRRIGLYCGGLYELKKLGFLIEAAELIRAKLPDFNLIVIGEGPDQSLIEAAANKHPWIHYVGAKFGMEKSCYFKLTDVFLLPGLVGLAVLDSFAAETPLFTTNLPIHSPEFDYLKNGENGFVTEYSVSEYAQTVIEYLIGPEEMKETVMAACRSSSLKYSVENMTKNFHKGIIQCLRA